MTGHGKRPLYILFREAGSAFAPHIDCLLSFHDLTLFLQDSNLLEEAVLTVGKVDRAGYLKVSWPAVRDWLLRKGVDQTSKSCRLRCQPLPPSPSLPLPNYSNSSCSPQAPLLQGLPRMLCLATLRPVEEWYNSDGTFCRCMFFHENSKTAGAEQCCGYRYQNQLAPDLNRSAMTPNEDEAIMFVSPTISCSLPSALDLDLLGSGILICKLVLVYIVRPNYHGLLAQSGALQYGH